MEDLVEAEEVVVVEEEEEEEAAPAVVVVHGQDEVEAEADLRR